MAGTAALAVASSASRTFGPEPESSFVNDIHSQLNSTRVLGISQPRSLEDVQSIVRTARKDRKVISVAGGRHAMGGQQFGADTLLIDIRKLSRVINLDHKRGIIEVEAGIRSDSTVQITSGLNAGDTVIITGIMQMRPDMPLKIKVLNAAPDRAQTTIN